MACNLKCWSWAVAILYLIVSVIAAIFFAIFLIIPKDEEFVEAFGKVNKWMIAVVGILLIYCLLVFGSSIALMVGLKQNRHKLMKPFIYTIYTGITLTISISIRLFIRGIRKDRPIGELAVELLSDLVYCAIQGALLYPVNEFYKQLKNAPDSTAPEQYTLNNYQPINKHYDPGQVGHA
ncbi:uncharacterized protein LOC142238503 [Haematobia irritans]|uniref:uncharacterized protein LOC142238503 n=1 Tax=Haematobia irritans TaxID=7368 RepID=UPI003F50B069